MMITLVLSSNMKRMLKNNVLVRKLVGIETSGSLNILFTDKTGTLTKGKLEVSSIIDTSLETKKDLNELNMFPKYQELFYLSLVYNNESSYDKQKNIAIGGNITDRCLSEFAKGNKDDKIKIIKTFPFDSKNKYSSVIIDNGEKLKLIKGAPEIILEKASSYYNLSGIKKVLIDKNKYFKKLAKYTNMGMRVIALASSFDTTSPNLRNLTLIGFILIKDELRKEALEGVELVKNAGISTVKTV